MYLPQWVVAAIAVFNAASDQPGDSTIAPTYWRPGPAVNGDEFVGVFMQTGVVLHHLSAKPEQGAVAVMAETKDVESTALWNVSYPTEGGGQFVRLQDKPDLCLTAKTRVEGDDEYEWEEVLPGPATLEPCRDDLWEEGQRVPSGQLWKVGFLTHSHHAELKVGLESFPLLYNLEAHNVSVTPHRSKGDYGKFMWILPALKE